MNLPAIKLPKKEELERRLRERIPAEEIEREKAFYLHGLMLFTEEHMGQADEDGLCVCLMMTMGANLSKETYETRRPIPIEYVIDVIVGDNTALGDAVKDGFANLIKRYRMTQANRD